MSVNKIYENIDDEEQEEDIEGIPDAEIFDQDFIDQIKEAKISNASSFQSYWEADENDVHDWTKKEIKLDPVKKFIHSAEMGNLNVMKDLIEHIKKGYKDEESKQKICQLLAAKDSDGYTAMHRACYSNKLDVVKYLVELEAEIDERTSQLEARTDMGWTPLHSAVYWNSYACVEYLLKYARGCDPNSRSNSGQTCLHVAAQQSTGRESILLLLMHPRIDFAVRNDQGETAYDIARRSCKYNALFEIAEESLNRL